MWSTVNTPDLVERCQKPSGFCCTHKTTWIHTDLYSQLVSSTFTHSNQPMRLSQRNAHKQTLCGYSALPWSRIVKCNGVCCCNLIHRVICSICAPELPKPEICSNEVTGAIRKDQNALHMILRKSRKQQFQAKRIHLAGNGVPKVNRMITCRCCKRTCGCICEQSITYKHKCTTCDMVNTTPHPSDNIIQRLDTKEQTHKHASKYLVYLFTLT
jgi:hypothetical protein